LKGRARILLGHFGSLGGEFPHDSDHGGELSAVHFVDVPTDDWLDGFLFIFCSQTEGRFLVPQIVLL
jgi:hypothetical protein